MAKPFSICCLINLLTTAYDLPLPGVPNTMVARNGLTMLIQPFHCFFLYQNLVGRLMEYSFSISLVSCIKLSFSLLNTSSIRLFFNNRLIYNPAIIIQIYPMVKVEI